MKIKNFFTTFFLLLSCVFVIVSCNPIPNDPEKNGDESSDGDVQLYGNCTNSAPGAVFGSFINTSTYGVASLLDGEDLKLEGTMIKGIRMYIGNSVTGGYIFVGADYENPTYTQSFAYKKGGWQYILFDEPIEVTGEDLYIGYMVTGNGYIFGYEQSKKATNSEFIFFNGVWSTSYRMAKQHLYWSIQAIITGGDYSDEVQNDIVVDLVTANSYSVVGESLIVGCEVRNNGIKVAKGITLTCDFGGKSTNIVVSDSLINGQSAYVEFNVSSPNLVGHQHIKTTAAMSNSIDENLDNDSYSIKHLVFAEDLERNAVFIEQFTASDCGYCPLATSYISYAISRLTDQSKVVWVEHYIGENIDNLTLAECNTTSTALSVSEVPSCAFNRVDVGLDGIFWHPASATSDLLQSAIDMPASATLDLVSQYDETTRKLTVNVSGRSTVTASDNYITVLIKENDIVMSQTDYYYDGDGEIDVDYVHNNVARLFLTEACGDLLSLDAENNYSATFTTILPEEIGGEFCDSENMDVVVFLHGDLSNKSECIVFNADQASLNGAKEPLSVRGLSNTSVIKDNSQILFNGICTK